MATVVECPDQRAVPIPLPYNHNVAYQAPITYSFTFDHIHANPTSLTSFPNSPQSALLTTPSLSPTQLPSPIHPVFNFSRPHCSTSIYNPYKSTDPQRSTSTPLLSPATTASLKSRIEMQIKSMPPGACTTTRESLQHPKNPKSVFFSSTSLPLSNFSFASRSSSSNSTTYFYNRSQEPSSTRSRSRSHTHTPQIIHRLRKARIALRTISLIASIAALTLALIALVRPSTTQPATPLPHTRTNTNTTTSTPLIVFAITTAFASLLFVATFVLVLKLRSAYLSPSAGPCFDPTRLQNSSRSRTGMRWLRHGKGRESQEVMFAISGVLAGAAVVAGCVVLARAGVVVADVGLGGKAGRAAWWVGIGVLGSEGMGMGAGLVGAIMGRRGG